MNKKITWLLFILHPSAFILSAEAGAALPEQTRGGLTARLTVHVADAGPQPGAALVLLTLRVTGGPLLQVEPATLADPLNAWEADRNEWCTLIDGRVTWTQSIRLKQVKPGPATLPDVKVRFRDGPSAAWEEAEWVDLLKTARDAPPPELSPSPATGPSWLPWVGLAVAVLVLTAVVWGLRRRRRSSRKTLPPDQWAMGELRRLEANGLTDRSSAAYHTALSDVVRRYLMERFDLPATRRTTAEFLETVARTGRLSAEQQALLRDFLERCDLAKFAPVGASPEEGREAAALARALVERPAGTASAQGSS